MHMLHKNSLEKNYELWSKAKKVISILLMLKYHFVPKIIRHFHFQMATNEPPSKFKIISGVSDKVEMLPFNSVYFLLKYPKN